ncbi:MAG TPA: antibiotic resistance protein VanZ [Aeromonadales bacterium]|nr:antibiotic resistance protein VanZ [Aeromonadales bacterium]
MSKEIENNQGEPVLPLSERKIILFYRIAFVITLIAIVFLALASSSQLTFIPDFSDKIKHFIAFLVLTFLADKSFVEGRYIMVKVLGLFTFGLLIEWAQSFTSYRYTEWNDVVADVVGIGCYWVSIFIFNAQNKRLKKPPEA